MGNPHSAGSLKDTENKWRMLKSFELPVLTLFAFRWPWAIQKFWKSLRRSQRWVLYSGYYVMIIVKVRVCDFNERLRIFDWQWTWDIVFPCPAEMQTKIWQKRIQNSRIGKTMWTLWGGPEEADFAKYSLQFPSCLHLADTGQRSNWTSSERIDFEQVTLNQNLSYIHINHHWIEAEN